MSAQSIALILSRLERIEHLIEEVREHAASTNGRVTRLELWRARLEGTRNAFVWLVPFAVGVTSALVGAAFS